MGDVKASCRRRHFGGYGDDSDEWEIKFIDENVARVKPEEFAWADVVFISGMHISAIAFMT